MQNKVNINDKEESEFLSSIKKENPFSVPENYFEFLPQEITEGCHKPINASNRKSYFFFQPEIAYSFAAITVLIFTILFFINKGDVASGSSELSSEEITYILQNPEHYNIEESVISEGLLAGFESSSDETTISEFEISDEEAQSYLEDNSELNNIINEL